MLIDTGLDEFKIRFAEEKDVSLILNFIKYLADYEKLSNEVVATEEILYESLFVRKVAEVIIGEYKNEPVAFAVFFSQFFYFFRKAGDLSGRFIRKTRNEGKGYRKNNAFFFGKIVCRKKLWEIGMVVPGLE